MDDPIFDPWSISEQGPKAAPTERTKRWRSAPGAERVKPVRSVPTRSRGKTGHALPGDVGTLRALLMPRLTRLAHRLQLARHRTNVDDRLDQPTPSLRLRMQPWQAPFAKQREGAGAVLEIRLDRGPAPIITGRIWTDPLAAAPTQQTQVEATKLTGAWVDRLLLEFVEKALSGG